jgi:hypothetical protein
MIRIIFQYPDPDDLGSGSIRYSNGHNKIIMPLNFVLLDLLTRKIKL